jgi:hypothetical protein
MNHLYRIMLVVTSLGLYWMYNVNVEQRAALKKLEAYQFEANKSCKCDP